jgi:hypothetical protein
MARMRSCGLGRTRKRRRESEGEKARRAEPKVRLDEVMVCMLLCVVGREDQAFAFRRPPWSFVGAWWVGGLPFV